MDSASAASAARMSYAALLRASQLLTILDREHKPDELYRTLVGVRHEVASALRLAPGEAPPKKREAAADRAKRTRPNSQRHAILSYLADKQGATANTVCRALPVDRAVARSRLAELQAVGWVTPYARVRSDTTGRKHTFYQVTEAGAAALARLASTQLALDIPA